MPAFNATFNHRFSFGRYTPLMPVNCCELEVSLMQRLSIFKVTQRIMILGSVKVFQEFLEFLGSLEQSKKAKINFAV